MSDLLHPTLPDKGEIADVLDLIKREAAAYLESIDSRPARAPKIETIDNRLAGPLPEHGDGAMSALRQLIDPGRPGR